jgi:NAD(P)-dependent dehydrogenase (short-subunit alcohol dehydrogenase family)
MYLTNASAIVTGSAGGFGSATVRRLAQMGAKVVIADVSKSALDARLGPPELEVSAKSVFCRVES